MEIVVCDVGGGWLGCGWDVAFVYKYIDIYASICKGYTRSVNTSDPLPHTPYRYMDNNDHGLYVAPYVYVRIYARVLHLT